MVSIKSDNSFGWKINRLKKKSFIFVGDHFNYSSKFLSLTIKVVFSQLTFTPIFNSYFFGMQSLLSGENIFEAWDRIKRTVPTSFINSCKFWPAVTAFSFTFIDPQYRSIFAGKSRWMLIQLGWQFPGIFAIGWQTYLSFINQKVTAEGKSERVHEMVTAEDSEVLVHAWAWTG